jgi:hypothetical protein
MKRAAPSGSFHFGLRCNKAEHADRHGQGGSEWILTSDGVDLRFAANVIEYTGCFVFFLF